MVLAAGRSVEGRGERGEGRGYRAKGARHLDLLIVVELVVGGDDADEEAEELELRHVEEDDEVQHAQDAGALVGLIQNGAQEVKDVCVLVDAGALAPCPDCTLPRTVWCTRWV
jgi:hypothetical protein